MIMTGQIFKNRMILYSPIWCILLAMVTGVQVMPISHHQKASVTDKEIYQIQTDGKIEWYHAGEAPKWSGTHHFSRF